jgi:hypothetical protein
MVFALRRPLYHTAGRLAKARPKRGCISVLGRRPAISQPRSGHYPKPPPISQITLVNCPLDKDAPLWYNAIDRTLTKTYLAGLPGPSRQPDHPLLAPGASLLFLTKKVARYNVAPKGRRPPGPSRQPDHPPLAPRSIDVVPYEKSRPLQRRPKGPAPPGPSCQPDRPPLVSGAWTLFLTKKVARYNVAPKGRRRPGPSRQTDHLPLASGAAMFESVEKSTLIQTLSPGLVPHFRPAAAQPRGVASRSWSATQPCGVALPLVVSHAALRSGVRRYSTLFRSALRTLLPVPPGAPAGAGRGGA